MAQDSTLGGLYLSLGLDISELESDFLAANRTTRENLNRLNRESNLVRLRAEVEIGNLDETADAVQILTVRENALNRQMAMQRDRIRIAEAQLRSLTQQHGEGAVVTQRAAAALERERLSLQRLQRELNEVTDAQNGLNNTQGSTNSSISDFTDSLGDIAGKAAPVVAAVGAVAGVMTTAATATTELIDKFRELQNQSYELNMPVAETKNFLREMRLAGGDIGDFEGYIRGITDAYVKGEWDDPEFLALSKYDAKITDEIGRLKDFKSITEEVYQAWEKANAAGEGIEFLQLTGGEAGVRDAIQYFQRYKEAKEDAAKIVDSGIDLAELHESERALNLLTEQTGEFKDALANAITPVAQDAMEKLFLLVRDGTEFIVNNTDEIQRWGFIAAEAVSTVSDKVNEVAESEGFQKFKTIFTEIGDLGLPSGRIKNFIGDALNDFFGDEWDGIVERAAEKQAEYNDTVDESAEKLAELEDKVKDTGNVLSQYGIQRVKEFKDELEDLNIELDFGGSEYDKAIAETDMWLQRELTDKLHVSLDEELALRELYAAKIEQIERDKEDRLEEIRESVNAEFQSELDKRLAKIEEDKDSWINSGMEEAEASELAEKLKTKALEEESAARQSIESDFTASVNSLYQTALDNRLAQIEKEKQAWIEKGIDEVEATRAAEQQKVDAQRDAAMSVIKNQMKEYDIFQQYGYEGLQAYKTDKFLKSAKVDPRILRDMTPETLAQFQEAQRIAERSILPNFMTEQDRADSLRLREQEQLYLQQRQQAEWERILDGIRINGERPNIDLSDGLKLPDTGVTGLNEDLTALSTSVNTATQGLDELPQAILDVTDKLKDLSGIVYEVPAQNADRQGGNSAPPAVNVNVTISEAHAWDTEHIQELADKVADQITPEVVNAIGGDSNRY